MTKLASIAMMLFLTACAQTVSQPTITTYAPVTVPNVQPITTNPVAVKIDNTGNAVLDQQSYENLQLNLLDINRYIKQEKSIVTMLENILQERSSGK